MKKVIVLAAAIAATFTGAIAQSVNWKLDASHSNISFAVEHMVVSETVGKFDKFDIKATTKNATDFEGATVNVDIQTASINTNDEKRDQHLRSGDFFDAEKNPTISFKSKSIKKVSGKNYKLTGDLTMHGVTKAITLDLIYGGTAKDPWGNTHAGFKLSGKLNRKDYGLNWSKTLETGGLLVGEEVTITGAVELLQEK